MAILRPRRGLAADAANIILARGEVFFEPYNSSYSGKIKMGDGTTKYSSLPDFIPHPDDMKIAFTNSSSATSESNNSTYLNNIVPTSTLKTIFTNLKQLLLNFKNVLGSVVYIDEQTLCAPSFDLNISQGQLIIRQGAPSSDNIGSIWFE